MPTPSGRARRGSSRRRTRSRAGPRHRRRRAGRPGAHLSWQEAADRTRSRTAQAGRTWPGGSRTAAPPGGREPGTTGTPAGWSTCGTSEGATSRWPAPTSASSALARVAAGASHQAGSRGWSGGRAGSAGPHAHTLLTDGARTPRPPAHAHGKMQVRHGDVHSWTCWARPSGVGWLLQDCLDLEEQLDSVPDHHAAAVQGTLVVMPKSVRSISPVAENPARVLP
jgi:hypothetical protein